MFKGFFGRTLLFAGAITAATFGMPYLFSDSTSVRQWLSQGWSSLRGDEANKAAAAQPAAAPPVGASGKTSELNIPGPKPLPPGGPPPQDIGEVLNFDVTTNWVLSRWDRVTTGLADLNLHGYRVPLVTGPREDDLAGSLSYYFTAQQKLQRIEFRGTTGNSAKLVALLTGLHKFTRETSTNPGEQLYQVKWNGAARSECRIRPARVVQFEAPRARYEVSLVMERPAGMK